MRPSRFALRGTALISTFACLGLVALAAPLDPSGDPDNSFSSDGKLFQNFTSTLQMAEGRAVGVQPSGKVVIGGGSVEGGQVFHFALVRLNVNGTQDTSWGAGGAVKTIIGSNDYVEDIAVQADGKVIAAG